MRQRKIRILRQGFQEIIFRLVNHARLKPVQQFRAGHSVFVGAIVLRRHFANLAGDVLPHQFAQQRDDPVTDLILQSE